MTFTNSYPQPNLQSQALSTSPSYTDKHLNQGHPFIGKFLQRMIDGLIRNSEPHFYQEMSATGEATWIAYDPCSKTTHTFDSEAMAITWIEQRYHKK